MLIKRKTLSKILFNRVTDIFPTSSSPFAQGLPSGGGICIITHNHTYFCTLTHPLTHSLTHVLTYSLTHSSTYTLTHSLTHLWLGRVQCLIPTSMHPLVIECGEKLADVGWWWFEWTLFATVAAVVCPVAVLLHKTETFDA